MQSTSQLVSLAVMDELGGLFRVDLKLYPWARAVCTGALGWTGRGGLRDRAV